MLTLKFKKLGDGAVLPTRATEGSAGYDLYVSEDVTVAPGSCTKAKTAIAVEIPEGFVGLIFPRSGLATKRNIRLSNCVAVIDSDYRGELLIPLYKDGDGLLPDVLEKGERIAQMVLVQYFAPEAVFVDELSATSRGTDGFGSTGK